MINTSFCSEPFVKRWLDVCLGGSAHNLLPEIGIDEMTILDIFLSKNGKFLVLKLMDIALVVVEQSSFECLFAKIETTDPGMVYSDNASASLRLKHINYVSQVSYLD